MKNTVFLFPGQGSQRVGMSKDLLDEYRTISENYFNKAQKILGYDIKDLCYKGPEEKINNTRYTQPAIFTVSAITLDILAENGIHPSSAAGHSLGEYTALFSAGVFDFTTGLNIVKERGRLMSEVDEVSDQNGFMAAVIGLDIEEIQDICSRAKGVLEIANINSPQQIIISGTKKAFDLAREEFENQGAKKIIELEVSGAFHSSLMKPVEKKFRSFLEEYEFDSPKITVIGNINARPLSTPKEIKNELYNQLTGTVNWVESMNYFMNKEQDMFVECGPGRVLRGLMRYIDRSADIYSINSVKNLSRLKKE